MDTAIMELKKTLQDSVDYLIDAIHGTDQYGYRDAMKSIIKMIDEKLLAKEKKQIIESYKEGGKGSGFNFSITAEDYYASTFKQK